MYNIPWAEATRVELRVYTALGSSLLVVEAPGLTERFSMFYLAGSFASGPRALRQAVPNVVIRTGSFRIPRDAP
jgi:hypothetical protein